LVLEIHKVTNEAANDKKMCQNMEKETTVTGCKIPDWLMEDRLSIYKIRTRAFLIIIL